MKTKNQYTQCLVQKENIQKVMWIETKFAITNNIIKLKFNSKWDNGWLVKEVYDININDDEILSLNQQYKHTREVSDI